MISDAAKIKKIPAAKAEDVMSALLGTQVFEYQEDTKTQNVCSVVYIEHVSTFHAFSASVISLAVFDSSSRMDELFKDPVWKNVSEVLFGRSCQRSSVGKRVESPLSCRRTFQRSCVDKHVKGAVWTSVSKVLCKRAC